MTKRYRVESTGSYLDKDGPWVKYFDHLIEVREDAQRIDDARKANERLAAELATALANVPEAAQARINTLVDLLAEAQDERKALEESNVDLAEHVERLTRETDGMKAALDTQIKRADKYESEAEALGKELKKMDRERPLPSLACPPWGVQPNGYRLTLGPDLTAQTTHYQGVTVIIMGNKRMPPPLGGAAPVEVQQ